MSKNQPIDWEAAMTESQKNTQLTAKLTERVLTSLTKVNEAQHRHSRTLAKLETVISEIRTEQVNLRSSILNRPKAKVAPVAQKPPFLRFWLGAAFVVGAVFGVFIMSL